MPAVAPLNLLEKTEAAFMAYLQARVAGLSGNALVSPRTVTLSRRVEVTAKILPRVVLSCPRGAPTQDAEQLYEIELIAYAGASAYESRDAGGPDADIKPLHAARVGLLTEWFSDKAAILTALNAPASGTDTRTVKGIRIEDIWTESEGGDTVDNHFINQLTYTVVAQLQDEAD